MSHVSKLMGDALFGTALPALLLGVGFIYFLALRGFPYFHPIRTLRHALGKNTRSALRALSVALGGTLGVGNITGVALALSAGGAGALFWMWASAIFAMFLKYGEVLLALLYRKRGTDGTWEGGAMYYLRAYGGRIGKFFAVLFAVLCLLCALTLGAPIQSNAAAIAANEVLGIPVWVIGGVLLLLTSAAVFGGARKIFSFTERVVPVMSVLYLCLSVYAVLTHAASLGDVFTRVFREAFSFSAGAAGTGGFLVSRAVRYGVTRGLLSNEAGAGTAPMAHAAAENAPAAQGIMGLWEVAIDTFVFCTATALPVLIAFPNGFPTGTGVFLVTEAFLVLVGPIAPPVLCVSIFLFAYATALAWCYYGKRALGYLSKDPRAHSLYLYGYVLAVFAGAFLGESVLFEITDGILCLLTMLHTAFLLPALPDVVKESRRVGLIGKSIVFRRQGEGKGGKDLAKIVGDRRENGNGIPVRGMGEGERCGVKHGARKTVSLSPIKAIAEDGMSQRR